MRALGEISGSELVSIAREAGYSDFNERRLGESHRAGLISTPRTDFPGGGGSVSYYPAGTDAQLLAMLEAKTLDRRHPEIAWRLWRQGYSVRFDYIQERLRRVARELDQIVEQLPDVLEDEDAQESILREAADGTLNPVAAHARAKVGRANFTTFAYVELLVMGGRFGGYEEAPSLLAEELSPEQIVERGIEADRARRESLPGVEPWLAEGTEEALRRVSSVFADARFMDALDRADPKRLEDGRRTLAAIAGSVPAAGEMLERQHGEGAFGAWMMKAVGLLGLDFEAFFVLFFLAASEKGIATPSPAVAEALAAEITEGLESEQRLTDLAMHVPALAPLVDSARIGEAARQPGGTEALRAEVVRVAEEHREEVDAWLLGSS